MKSTAATSVYDVTDLKEKIPKLKETQKQRILERQQLEMKLAEKEALLAKMRQEYTVLQPSLELRYHNNTTSAAASVVLNQPLSSTPRGAGAAGDGIENDRSTRQNAVHLADAIVDKDLLDDSHFLIMNEKLEMQILLQEMRQVIPQLEELVKFYEKQTERHKKHVLRREITDAQAKTKLSQTIEDEEEFSKPLLLLSNEECHQLTEKIMKEIIDHKLAKRVLIEKQKQANQALVQSLNYLRKEIQQKLSERLSLKRFVLKYEKDYILQQKKRQAVIEDFCAMRKTCEEKGQFLWQTAIFKQEAGSESGRISLDRIPSLLSRFICIKNSEISWTSREYLMNLVRKIRADNEKYQQRGRQASLSEQKEKEEEAEDELNIIRPADSIKKEDNDISEIDLVTFCLLANQLILILE